MAYLGTALFILFFVLIAPQSQKFLVGLAVGAGTFVSDWAPFSYILLAILLVSPFAAMYIVHTWPQRVDPGNPMAKYRNEVPVDDD